MLYNVQENIRGNQATSELSSTSWKKDRLVRISNVKMRPVVLGEKQFH